MDGVLCATCGGTSPSNTFSEPGRRDTEWWIGPSCGEEDSSWLVFSVAFWVGEDVALVAIVGQTKGWSSSGFCPQ